MGPSSSALLITFPRFPRVKMVLRLRREGLEKKRGWRESRATGDCQSHSALPRVRVLLPPSLLVMGGSPKRKPAGARMGGFIQAKLPVTPFGGRPDPATPSGPPGGKDILLACVLHSHEVILLSHFLVLQVRETEHEAQLGTVGLWREVLPRNASPGEASPLPGSLTWSFIRRFV